MTSAQHMFIIRGKNSPTRKEARSCSCKAILYRLCNINTNFQSESRVWFIVQFCFQKSSIKEASFCDISTRLVDT